MFFSSCTCHSHSLMWFHILLSSFSSENRKFLNTYLGYKFCRLQLRTHLSINIFHWPKKSVIFIKCMGVYDSLGSKCFSFLKQERVPWKPSVSRVGLGDVPVKVKPSGDQKAPPEAFGREWGCRYQVQHLPPRCWGWPVAPEPQAPGSPWGHLRVTPGPQAVAFVWIKNTFL